MTQFLRRTALILAGASSLAACSTYEPFEGQGPPPRPHYPVQLPVPPAPAPPSAPPAAPSQARPTSPIEGRTLPPAGSNQPGYVTPSTPPAPPAPPPPPPAYTPPPQVYQPLPPPPPPAPPPRTQTVTRTTVTGKVVDVDGPRVTYTVEKRDNLDAIGRKLGVDHETLAKDNKLKPPYLLHPGQELKGPVTRRKAYAVGAGDTLFSIGKRFGVTAKALGEENGLKPGAGLKPGQKVRLPEDFKDKGPIKTTTKVTIPAPPPPPSRPAYTPPAAAPPPAYTPPAPAPAPPPAYVPPPFAPTPRPPYYPPAAAPPTRPAYVPPPPATTPYRPLPPPPAPPSRTIPPPATGAIVPTTPMLTDQQISDLGRGRFLWPVRGEIISGFGPKGTGQRNDGINIRVGAGEPVRAAAAGDVVYAGDQVPGFGNLVLVKHADGWVTAYGHLARSDVKMQQKVAQGQQLGTVGATGGVTEPQMHFEVRYAPTPADRARPIDPNLVLPK
ncbi:LysM peptidoglycan-binding domain-containing M23 family metallopeptidase [Phenylobacterium sp.]|uniref:LysM peptidoglycan-binding domain-containing M23 family metallopeptidase n=1 Tax=Phenylobacterium sp. TaxID=1871053 RepID=UPI002F3EEF97